MLYMSVVRDLSQGANPLGNEELRQYDSEGEYQRGLIKIWTKVGDFKPTHFSITDATLFIFDEGYSQHVCKVQITG